MGELGAAFVAAGVEAGFARTDDLNGASPEGFGPMEYNARGRVSIEQRVRIPWSGAPGRVR